MDAVTPSWTNVDEKDHGRRRDSPEPPAGACVRRRVGVVFGTRLAQVILGVAGIRSFVQLHLD